MAFPPSGLLLAGVVMSILVLVVNRIARTSYAVDIPAILSICTFCVSQLAFSENNGSTIAVGLFDWITVLLAIGAVVCYIGGRINGDE